MTGANGQCTSMCGWTVSSVGCGGNGHRPRSGAGETMLLSSPRLILVLIPAAHPDGAAKAWSRLVACVHVRYVCPQSRHGEPPSLLQAASCNPLHQALEVSLQKCGW